MRNKFSQKIIYKFKQIKNMFGLFDDVYLSKNKLLIELMCILKNRKLLKKINKKEKMKYILQKLNTKIKMKNNYFQMYRQYLCRSIGIYFLTFSFVFVFFIFSFFFNSNISLAADTTPPTVNLTYSSNPTKAGTETITAIYSEPISSTPNISINQPGDIDITTQAMTLLPNGVTWTAQTAAEANSWASVAYGNGLFVAVSAGGTNRVMTSSDGITWTPRTAAEKNMWRSIVYGNGLFVAVSQGGTNRVMTSPDGII